MPSAEHEAIGTQSDMPPSQRESWSASRPDFLGTAAVPHWGLAHGSAGVLARAEAASQFEVLALGGFPGLSQGLDLVAVPSLELGELGGGGAHDAAGRVVGRLRVRSWRAWLLVPKLFDALADLGAPVEEVERDVGGLGESAEGDGCPRRIISRRPFFARAWAAALLRAAAWRPHGGKGGAGAECGHSNAGSGDGDDVGAGEVGADARLVAIMAGTLVSTALVILLKGMCKQALEAVPGEGPEAAQAEAKVAVAA